jgi:hypothetical protein
MSSDKKNNQQDKKMDILQDPRVIYGTEENFILDDSNKTDPILEKLILKGIQDSKEEKGITHKEMIQKMKLKYPFLK